MNAVTSQDVGMSRMQRVKPSLVFRAPRGRQPVPGPFLSPNAAPFYPRRPPGGAYAGNQALSEQAVDVSMPDWKTQVGM